MKKSSIYNKLRNTWRHIKNRCYNKNDPAYKNYGGRGIAVCDEWLNSFESFESWALNNGCAEGLTIERIDNDGNYCPENCKWATMLEQSNNRRSNILVTYLGKTQTLTQWARELGKIPSVLKDSYHRGTFPPKDGGECARYNKLIEYQGKALTIKQWAEELNIKYGTMSYRVSKGIFPPKEGDVHKAWNRLIAYKGKSMTMKQWAEELGITYSAMKGRVYSGKFPPKETID